MFKKCSHSPTPRVSFFLSLWHLADSCSGWLVETSCVSWQVDVFFLRANWHRDPHLLEAGTWKWCHETFWYKESVVSLKGPLYNLIKVWHTRISSPETALNDFRMIFIWNKSYWRSGTPQIPCYYTYIKTSLPHHFDPSPFFGFIVFCSKNSMHSRPEVEC